jgi:DNA-binding GntR family transcriptional regulator
MIMAASPIRDLLRERVRRDLVRGKIPPGEPIRLEPLAERHSVSITPVREALTQLQAEGWVVLHPNRGFFAAPMTLEEARSIYPLLSALEGLAVELTGAPSRDHLDQLREINRRLAAFSEKPQRALELDRRWHEALVRRCANDLLLEHLRSVRTRSERYERAYMRHSGRVPTSAHDHERIVEALADDPARARGMLREHWNRSLAFVREWLPTFLDPTTGEAHR